MATIDKGFKVGDWCVPERTNIWTKTKEPCQVTEEDGRYTMRIRLPDGSTEFVHPYLWSHAAELIAGQWGDMGQDLLPCPFCGSTPVIKHLRPSTKVVIYCAIKDRCGVQPTTYEEGLPFPQAQVSWNQRPH